ncbi:MAG: hypothetical protein P1S46_00265 [bacterium]|nr:hypothetical protein [bacterium]MDT8395249.1 hypothetical protein [bacterium]
MKKRISRQIFKQRAEVSRHAARELSGGWAVLLLIITVLMALAVGWHREIASRYPISDLPFVDLQRLSNQIESGNVGKTGALYYRKSDAGADTTEIR